jgi:hypothetical protein
MPKSIEIVHAKGLLRIKAQRQRVKLDFGEVAVDLLAYIEIVSADGRIDTIDDVWKCEGNLNALWPLVGQRMVKIVMDGDSFRLTFEDGTLIRGRNRKAFDFVKVWEPGRETGYPTAVLYLSEE